VEPRTLTVREAARLQGISDDFRFPGHASLQERQVGNAFPPPLAAAIGRHLAKQLQEIQAYYKLLARMEATAQIMDLDRDGPGADEDGLQIPREILDYIPRQLGDLHLQLEQAEDAREAETPRPERGLPTVVGHLDVPPIVGTVADIGGAATVIAFLGHVAGLW
jgi:hypothetical protein